MSKYGSKRKRTLPVRGSPNEEKIGTAPDYVPTLEGILKHAKKKLDFSMVTTEDLMKAGITTKFLYIAPAKATMKLSSNAAAGVIEDLQAQINKIYERVNMDYARGSRMIIDAILLASAEIVSIEGRHVAILPDMMIARGAGVQIALPSSGYELWVQGNADYAIFEYDDIHDNMSRLIAPGGGQGDDAFIFSKSCMFVIEAKCKTEKEFKSVAYHVPEAVSQAIAVLRSENLPEVHFCLSDGHSWMFFILKLEHGILTCYESTLYLLKRDGIRPELNDFTLPLCDIVVLVCEWLRPTTSDVYTLAK